MIKKRSLPSEIPHLPSVCVRAGPLGKYPVREHRRCVKGAHPGQVVRTAFCEVADEAWEEFNSFCRLAAYTFEERAQKAFSGTDAPVQAFFTLRLSPAGKDGTFAFLHVSARSGGDGKHTRGTERRFLLEAQTGRLLRMRDLTKKQKKTILN